MLANFAKYDTQTIKINSSSEAEAFGKAHISSSATVVSVESYNLYNEVLGEIIPLEYMIGYPAGSHMEYSYLLCTGNFSFQFDDPLELISDSIAARCAVNEYNKRMNSGLITEVMSNTSISNSGTLQSGIKYWTIRSTPEAKNYVVLSTGTILAGCRITMPAACFEEGTKVLTIDGLKSIETIKEDDLVLSKNESTGEIEEQKVYHTYSHNPRVAYRIVLENGENLIATWSHTFYVKGIGETSVEELKIGDILTDKNNKEIKIKEIDKNHIINKPVYEIWVENNRNYFVGDGSILVYSEREVIE